VPFYVLALIVHGALGGLDVFVNHEWLARLPARRDAVTEQPLHSARELLFCLAFVSLGWFEWHGAAAWWIVLLYAGEVGVSAVDVVVEGEIRVLPRSERVLHLFLFMNLGALVVLVGQALLAWRTLPTAVVAVDHGWASWVLTVMGIGALVWSVRDGLSAARMQAAR
jgi:phosphatidylglycerophosphate synthase